MNARTRASIHTSEVLTVVSENTGQEYQIALGLPPSYNHEPEKSFPAIYVVDGNLLFEMVTGITRMMQLGREIPEVVVVSIGYPLEGFYGDDFNEFFIRRAKDLTAVVDKRYEQFLKDSFEIEHMEIETGGAEHFLNFVAEELTSVIEARYRVSSTNRTLLGHSSGGHFALYTLLHKPEVFENYVVGSPSLGFGEGVLFKMESEYAKQHKKLPGKLFLGIGDEEEYSSFSPAGYLGTIVSVSDFVRFAAIIRERAYDGMNFAKKVFEGYGHTDVVGPFISAGLKYVLANEKD